jgi:hypothetical protein
MWVTRKPPWEKVGGGELPLERLCCGVVAVFECSKPVPDLVEVGEVVGRDDLALHDGEEHLDLVRPGGVDGCVDHDRVRKPAAQAVDGCLAAMGGAVVDDREDPSGAGVGLAGHDVLDQRHERHDARGGFASAHDPGLVDVVGGQVGERATAFVLVVDAHDLPVSAGNWQGRALSPATCTGVKRGGRPGRLRSSRAGRPPVANRPRHRRTVSTCSPVSPEIRALERPRAARSTTSARTRA